MSTPRCARLFFRHSELGRDVGDARDVQFPSAHEVFLFITSVVDGAASLNRGGVAETPFLARTQSRTVGSTRHRRFRS